MHGSYARALALLTLATLGACAPRPRTEVVVYVRADPEITALARSLRVQVRGGVGVLGLPVEFPVTNAGAPLPYPVRVAVVPKGEDASRIFEVDVEASAPGPVRVGSARVVSGFVRGRTLRLELLLEDCCRTVVCDDSQTCRGCECGDPFVPPETLPPEGSLDAAVSRDAGGPELDGGLVDTGPSPDAAPRDGGRADAASPDAASPDAASPDAASPDAANPDAGGGCGATLTVPSAGGSVSFEGSLTAASTWQRPAPGASPSACPGGTLMPGTERVAREVVTLCSTASAPVTVVVDMYGRSMAGLSLTDPYLVAYGASTIPADVSDCLAQNDDATVSVLDARITVDVPAGGTISLVATTLGNDLFGTYRMTVSRP